MTITNLDKRTHSQHTHPCTLVEYLKAACSRQTKQGKDKGDEQGSHDGSVVGNGHDEHVIRMP